MDLEEIVHTIREHEGYEGCFTRHQAEHAIANGHRIEKAYSEPGDANEVGTQGTVLGSLFHDVLGLDYFVEWDTYPKRACFVMGVKIREIVCGSAQTGNFKS